MRDLLFLDETPDKVVKVPFKLLGECSGRVALAQRVMTMLLRRTDDVARSTETGILQELGSANIRETAEMRNDFTLALSTISQLIQSDQETKTGLADDERLASLELEELTVGEDDANVIINIVTVSGDSFRVSTDI